METTVLGYPRIGARRELEKATEAFLAGRETRVSLTDTAAALRRETWETLRDAVPASRRIRSRCMTTCSTPP